MKSSQPVLKAVGPCPGTRVAGSRWGSPSASQNTAAVSASAVASDSACTLRPTMRSRGASAATSNTSAPSMRASREKAVPPAIAAGPFMPGMPRTSIRWPTSSRAIASAAGASSATRSGTRLPMPCQPVENASMVTTTENTSRVVWPSTYQRGCQGSGPGPPSTSQAMPSASAATSTAKRCGMLKSRVPARPFMPPLPRTVRAAAVRARAPPGAG